MLLLLLLLLYLMNWQNVPAMPPRAPASKLKQNPGLAVVLLFRSAAVYRVRLTPSR